MPYVRDMSFPELFLWKILMAGADMDNKNKRTVIGFSGFSGSGKTTLIEKLIPVFKDRGYHVAVIKHDAHDFEIDREGKDTYRFTRAGADQVYIASSKKSARMNSASISLDEMLSDCRDADIVFIEGYRDSDIKKIGITGSDTEYKLPGQIDDFEAIVSDDAERFRKLTGKPVFDRDDITAISDWLVPAFTHFDDEGNARMVTVADKDVTRRTATAGARVLVNESTYELIKQGGIKKGDVLTVAQIAGIMGAKRTPDLIPMCHPVIIDGADVRLRLNEEDKAVEIEAAVTCTGRTGVEMEAITACAVAAMTVYDMCKAVQRDIMLTDICLLSKSGGIHGDYVRKGKQEAMKLSAGILAGGKSSRMKRDKAFLDWEGVSLIEYMTKKLSFLSEVMISCGDPEKYAGLGLPLIIDENADTGPLEGIRRLLLAASNERVFICAVDMPFITKELVLFLKDRMKPDSDCILAKNGDDPEPLCAIYKKSILPAIEGAVAKGEHRIRDIFDKSRVQYADLSEGGFSAGTVQNLNTWPEYCKAKGDQN